MVFTQKSMIFNTNSKQHLLLWRVYCYLASGTIDTSNSLGNACIQVLYVCSVEPARAVQISCTTCFKSSTLSISDMCHGTQIFIISQAFWILLRSGLWAGQDKVLMEWSRFQSFGLAEAKYIVPLRDPGSVFKVLCHK